MITYLYRAPNMKSTITFLAFNSLRKSLIGAREKPSFLAIILFNNYHNQVLQTGFLRVY